MVLGCLEGLVEGLICRLRVWWVGRGISTGGFAVQSGETHDRKIFICGRYNLC